MMKNLIQKIQKKLNLKHRLADEKGVVLIWTALFLVVMLGMAALSIDLGYAYIVSNELKSVADAASLTAASAYVEAYRTAVQTATPLSPTAITAIQNQVMATVQLVRGRNNILNINASGNIDIEIQYGRYTQNNLPFDGTQFTDLTSQVQNATVPMEQVTAFRVFARRGNNSGNQLNYFFARILGFTNFSLTRDTVSRLAPRNFEMVIDTSSSMDDLTYPPNLNNTQYPRAPGESYVIYSYTGDANSPRFSPYSPAPGARFTGFTTALYPQPLQTVLDTANEFVQGLQARVQLGDLVAIQYFSDRASVKQPLTELTNVNAVPGGLFDLILKNQTLYNNLIPGTPPAFPANFPAEHFVLSTGTGVFDFNAKQYNTGIAIPFGDTNIGDAIQSGQNDIATNAGTGGQSISVIILFTDGVPTCAPASVNGPVTCYGTTITPAQQTAARTFTFQRATDTISQGILIYPVIYGSLDSDTRLLMQEIAMLSGLPDFFDVGTSTDINDIRNELNDIFQQISLLIPFTLMN